MPTPRKPIMRQLRQLKMTFANGASINAASSNDIRSFAAQNALQNDDKKKKKFDKRI